MFLRLKKERQLPCGTPCVLLFHVCFSRRPPSAHFQLALPDVPAQREHSREARTLPHTVATFHRLSRALHEGRRYEPFASARLFLLDVTQGFMNSMPKYAACRGSIDFVFETVLCISALFVSQFHCLNTCSRDAMPFALFPMSTLFGCGFLLLCRHRQLVGVALDALHRVASECAARAANQRHLLAGVEGQWPGTVLCEKFAVCGLVSHSVLVN